EGNAAGAGQISAGNGHHRAARDRAGGRRDAGDGRRRNVDELETVRKRVAAAGRGHLDVHHSRYMRGRRRRDGAVAVDREALRWIAAKGDGGGARQPAAGDGDRGTASRTASVRRDGGER